MSEQTQTQTQTPQTTSTLFDDQLDLPDFLIHPSSLPEISAPDVPTPSISKSRKQLLITQYEQMFEVILEKISLGIPLFTILKTDQRHADYAHFMNWIHRDPQRKARYHEAQEMGTEMMVGECLEIADGVNALEDVTRSKLRIDVRMKLIGSWNRKRYGDVKQIEMNGSISILDAIKAANQRIVEGEIIDAEPEDRLSYLASPE